MSSRKSCNAGYIKRLFTPQEDSFLKYTIGTNGATHWNELARSLPGRTAKQCRERWHNHLREGIKKGEWSTEEDLTILSSHEKLGNRWSKISKLLIKRSNNDIKNRYYSLLKTQKLNELIHSNTFTRIPENTNSKSGTSSITDGTTTSSNNCYEQHNITSEMEIVTYPILGCDKYASVWDDWDAAHDFVNVVHDNDMEDQDILVTLANAA